MVHGAGAQQGARDQPSDSRRQGPSASLSASPGWVLVKVRESQRAVQTRGETGERRHLEMFMEKLTGNFMYAEIINKT